MKTLGKEQISLLADGETTAESYDTVLTALAATDNESRAALSRYRLIGEVIRDQSARPVEVADAVRAAIAAEPTVLAPTRKAAPAWLKPVAGVAVAASVAAAAIVVVPQVGFDEPSMPTISPTFVSQSPMVAQPRLVANGPSAPQEQQLSVEGGAEWKTLDADLADRLNRLVIEHHEFAGRSGVTGPVPHIGVVSYGAE
jgi:sigma-E factor negative regulatory protein RseA